MPASSFFFCRHGGSAGRRPCGASPHRGSCFRSNRHYAPSCSPPFRLPPDGAVRLLFRDVQPHHPQGGRPVSRSPPSTLPPWRSGWPPGCRPPRAPLPHLPLPLVWPRRGRPCTGRRCARAVGSLFRGGESMYLRAGSARCPRSAASSSTSTSLRGATWAARLPIATSSMPAHGEHVGGWTGCAP